jgi:hypothetical protein
MYKLIGIITLLICFVLFWYNKDLLTELIDGRPLSELRIRDLLFPLILLIVGIYLLVKKTNDEKK